MKYPGVGYSLVFPLRGMSLNATKVSIPINTFEYLLQLFTCSIKYHYPREAVEGGGMSSSHQAPADPGPSPSRQPGPSPPRQPHFRRSNSGSEKTTAKGGMFATSTRQQPSHYTVHPDWASEASGSFRKK